MDVFELQAKISLDASDYEQSVKKAARKAEDLEESFEDSGRAAKEAEKDIDGLGSGLDSVSSALEGSKNGLDGLSGSITGGILKANLLTAGFELVANAAKELVSYVWNLDEATEEYRNAMTKLDTAFQTNGFSASTAESAFKSLYAVVGDIDQATEASQLLANLATDTEDVANWTKIATGVVATFGDSLPVESLIEAANETARTGTVVGSLADALNWAGQTGEDEFNAMLASCSTQEQRTQLITENLIATYGEAAAVFEENAEAVMRSRESHLRLEEAQADVGAETARLKNALSRNVSYSLVGLNSILEDVVGGLADFAEGSAESKTQYDDFLKSIDTKIQSDNIEEVAEAIEMINQQTKLLEEGGTVPGLGFFGSIGYANELSDALDNATDRYKLLMESGGELDSSLNQTAEAIEIATASANGFSVELTNSGLTAEEASSRLQTYTDAALNMFNQISMESEISYSEAVANLEANIQATQDFANNMTEIASILPGNLAEVFSAGGPALYAGVVSMLAEANRGTDEGLSEINELWSQGGEVAVNAFLESIGMVPADTENPATIVSAQMEQDTSMEIAAEGVVGRTYSAMSAAVASSGFDSLGVDIGLKVAQGLDSSKESAYSAGQNVIQRFIDGMESKKSSAVSTASSIGSASANALGGYPTGYSTNRLDYAPYDNYPIIASNGKTLLTASELTEYRGDRRFAGGITINQYISAVPQTPAELAAATQAYFEQARWAI